MDIKFHYCVRIVLSSSQLAAVHFLTSYFLRIHFNIILLFAPWSPNWCFPFLFSILLEALSP
jgi:hypothetical protein